jgi:hypothetical protein
MKIGVHAITLAMLLSKDIFQANREIEEYQRFDDCKNGSTVTIDAPQR